MNFWGIVSFCLSVLPRCLNVMILVSFQTDRYMQVNANSVDPDQTPVPSGFTMFAILSASFWLIMSKNDPDKEWWLQFFLYSSTLMKMAIFAYAKTKTQ